MTKKEERIVGGRRWEQVFPQMRLDGCGKLAAGWHWGERASGHWASTIQQRRRQQSSIAGRRRLLEQLDNGGCRLAAKASNKADRGSPKIPASPAATTLSDDFFLALKQFSSSIEHNISSFLGMQGPKMEYSNEKWDGEEEGKSEGKEEGVCWRGCAQVPHSMLLILLNSSAIPFPTVLFPLFSGGA